MTSLTDSAQLNELEARYQSEGPQAACDLLIEQLRQARQYHQLFDAQLLKLRMGWGLPTTDPTTINDVPEEHRTEFEAVYRKAAEEVGELYLAEGNLTDAWTYLRVVRQPEKLREAIEAFPIPQELTDETDQLINLALYEQLHPAKGVEIMLQTHGMCNTVTAFDQVSAQLETAQRRECARLMVACLYEDLRRNVLAHVQKRDPLTPAGQSLSELIAGRDWLFADDNYHIDVSHLNAVVRFARALEADDAEFDLALQLTDYGQFLAPSMQYPGELPFDDFYPAHQAYFNVLGNRDQEVGFQYFLQKLEREPDVPDQQLIAYVLVDMYMRTGQKDKAVQTAREHLQFVDDQSGFSFPVLCQDAEAWEDLAEFARTKQNPILLLSALSAKAVPS